MMASDKSRLKSKRGEISKSELPAVKDAIRLHLVLAKARQTGNYELKLKFRSQTGRSPCFLE
jgi:hypothetical protein